MIALRDSPFCIIFFISPDTSAVPGDIEDNAYAKLGGGRGAGGVVYKVYCGRSANGK